MALQFLFACSSRKDATLPAGIMANLLTFPPRSFPTSSSSPPSLRQGKRQRTLSLNDTYLREKHKQAFTSSTSGMALLGEFLASATG